MRQQKTGVFKGAQAAREKRAAGWWPSAGRSRNVAGNDGEQSGRPSPHGPRTLTGHCDPDGPRRTL